MMINEFNNRINIYMTIRWLLISKTSKIENSRMMKNDMHMIIAKYEDRKANIVYSPSDKNKEEGNRVAIIEMNLLFVAWDFLRNVTCMCPLFPFVVRWCLSLQEDSRNLR